MDGEAIMTLAWAMMMRALMTEVWEAKQSASLVEAVPNWRIR